MIYIYWDPPKEAFRLPFLDQPIAWYGILFALGFFLSYYIVRQVFAQKIENKELATKFVDKLTLYVLIGTLVGARFGEVLFYSWPYYWDHPGQILKIWEGGLASHGGLVGIMVAIFFFCRKFKKFSFLFVLDAVAIGAALTGALIRMGNFINQEILGKVTDLPWAVVFGHPMDAPGLVPRHPVQLYESLCYFATFTLLYILWKKKPKTQVLREGIVLGWFLVLVFGCRLFLEFLKLPQGELDLNLFLTTGQLLSLPTLFFGALLLLRQARAKVKV